MGRQPSLHMSRQLLDLSYVVGFRPVWNVDFSGGCLGCGRPPARGLRGGSLQSKAVCGEAGAPQEGEIDVMVRLHGQLMPDYLSRALLWVTTSGSTIFFSYPFVSDT